MWLRYTLRGDAKRLVKTLRLNNSSVRMFSAEAGEQKPAENIEKEFPEPTEEEKQKYRDAWGLKFNDECIKFEKEWEQIAEEANEKQRRALDEELDVYQKRKCEFLADKLLGLNTMEMRYVAINIRERVQKTTGINPLKLNMDWPSIKMDSDGTWPPMNPNWFKQQELMAQVAPFMGLGGGGGGGGGQAQEGQGVQEEEEEKKPEAVAKTNFDLELTSFDAKEKIKLIKEIRAILNLGLKEAKEMVEGVPVWIKKDVKKEDAEEIVKKLEPLGAQLKIV